MATISIAAMLMQFYQRSQNNGSAVLCDSHCLTVELVELSMICLPAFCTSVDLVKHEHR